MGSESHIVDFSTRKVPDNQSSRFGELSVTAEESLSIYLRELNHHLREMLVNADDHLFDKSGKSEDSRHFIVLRTLRVKKESLLSSFKQAVINYFRESVGKFNDAEFLQVDETEGEKFESLSLVGEDQLEENIAIDSMVSKARKENELALDNLRQRMDVLLPDRVITQEINPFDPVFICNAFCNSLKPVELSVEFKLVLYKYFERNVINQLEVTYQDVNDYFIKRGILPELKRRPIKKATNHQRSEEKIKTELDSHNNEELISLLGELLANRRGDNDSRVEQQVNTQQLINVLSDIQIPANYASDSKTAISDVRTEITKLLPSSVAGQVANGALGQFNDDMIDIVTMLFDFILDDDNLQSEVKAVISRLQIPILKVGLIDKTFFSNRKHSARLLLNELAHTGVSWDPEDKSSEPMLVKIRAIVETVCSDFSDDVAIFRVLLDDFLDFKQEFSKRAQIFEKRTKEAEEGKAKAEGARAKVNRELKKICHNKHVPEVVQQLFRNAWVHVMFLESLRADEDAWARVCQLARMLVWSVQPVHEQERLNKLIKNVPLLIKNLNLGFTKISFSHIEASGLLDRLEDTHREIIQKARVAIKENDKEVIIRLKPVDPMAGNVENHEGSNNIEESGVEAFNKVEIESIAFTEEQIGMLNKSAKGNIKIEEESRNKVENLHAGSWFELKIKEGFKRCKLAARILSSGKFIFVNRSGVKVAEYLTDELAIEYQLRNLKVLNDEALFDRALESVISNLRTMKSTS